MNQFGAQFGKIEKDLKNSAEGFRDIINSFDDMDSHQYFMGLNGYASSTGKSPNDAEYDLYMSSHTMTKVEYYLLSTKWIIFSGEQAEIFLGTPQNQIDDYQLPFPHTSLFFSKPISVHEVDVIGLLLSQDTFSKSEYEEMIGKYGSAPNGGKPRFWHEANKDMEFKVELPFGTPKFISDASSDFTVTMNSLSVLRRLQDRIDPVVFHWQEGIDDIQHKGIDDDLPIFQDLKSLAIACIGYINCENVYLERQDTSEKVNRKRERKGKSRLEPYYICKIRGVNYDSHSTGTGSQHGHRYDVRGHFRRLQTGKVIWVRPHQRGLQNELYIPKTYVVEKQS